METLNRFSNLSWNDLAYWAGDTILSRGKEYQRQGDVNDLVLSPDGNLLAWVLGTHIYATKVWLDSDGNLQSYCTCPCDFTCKHAVAVVLEYLDRLRRGQPVTTTCPDDERHRLLAAKTEWEKSEQEEAGAAEILGEEIEAFLKQMTKTKLIRFVSEMAKRHPDIAEENIDQQKLKTGNAKTVLTRLRKEIREMADVMDADDDWREADFTPDFSKLQRRLKSLLDAGCADELLPVGLDLINAGNRIVESSDDEGNETASEVADCLEVIVEALDQSSLEAADRLNWALDAVFKGQFDICEPFAQYLHRKHTPEAWSVFADRQIIRLKEKRAVPKSGGYYFHDNRIDLSNWIIHALEQSGRKDEIIPFCETEVKISQTYDRLVGLLIEANRMAEAEKWINEGIRALGNSLPGIMTELRNKYREIRAAQSNWAVVAAVYVEDFVGTPSIFNYIYCRNVCERISLWPNIRSRILNYLSKGDFPWTADGWPLPETGLERLKVGQVSRTPKLDLLMEIAIEEDQPEQLLYWFDRLPKERFGWRDVTDDRVAEAVKTYAPDRAVEIWKSAVEELIAEVKPRAYEEAIKLLRKAQPVAVLQGKQTEWDRYIVELRVKHKPKRKLMDLLDNMEGRPSVKRRR